MKRGGNAEVHKTPADNTAGVLVCPVFSWSAHKNHIAAHRTDLDHVSRLRCVNHLPVSYIDAAVRYRRTDIAGLRIAYLRPGNKVICCIRMYILS